MVASFISSLLWLPDYRWHKAEAWSSDVKPVAEWIKKEVACSLTKSKAAHAVAIFLENRK